MWVAQAAVLRLGCRRSLKHGSVLAVRAQQPLRPLRRLRPRPCRSSVYWYCARLVRVADLHVLDGLEIDGHARDPASAVLRQPLDDRADGARLR